jgi:hypothetical protein
MPQHILTVAELISLPVGSIVHCTNGTFTKVERGEPGLPPAAQRVWQRGGGDPSVFGASVLINFEPVHVSGPACDTCDKPIDAPFDACSCAACPSCFDRVDATKICEVCNQCDGCCACSTCEEGEHKVEAANLCDNCSKCDSDVEGHCDCPVCSGCSEKKDKDTICSECDQCESCCDCRACQGVPRGYGNTPRRHKDMVPEGDDYCDRCDRCFACCEHVGNCYTCSGCDERRSTDDGVCSRCDQCQNCCNSDGNCFYCGDCGEVQSIDEQCSQCAENGDYNCDDHCPGHEPDFEPLLEREEPGSVIPGLPKWTAKLAAEAEKSVSRPEGCDLHDEICDGGVSFRERNRSRDMTAIVADTFKINKSHRFLTCEIETDHDYGEGENTVNQVARKWDMKIEHDGSIRGLEIITTPANGDAFVRQSEELCAALVTDGIVATRFGRSDTGFHLHVDARDLSWADLKRMFTLWSHVERAALDALRPERQATLSRWSKPRADTGEAAEGGFLDPRRTGGGEAAAKKRLIGALGEETPIWGAGDWAENDYVRTPGQARRGEKVTLTSGGAGEWATDRRPSERYYALNGMSLFRLGTVEIRAMESTSNAEDLVCWGMLWAAFTDATKGMSREKMLKLIRQNPRTVLLDMAPSARVKTWLKRRWKLYAPAESEGARARRGLRHVKPGEKGPAPAPTTEPEVPVLTPSEIDDLPIGAMVVPAGTELVYVKTEPSTWLNLYGEPLQSEALQRLYAGRILNAPLYSSLYVSQLDALPVGSIVERSIVAREQAEQHRWTKTTEGTWRGARGVPIASRFLGPVGVKLISMPWILPATVQYRW